MKLIFTLFVSLALILLLACSKPETSRTEVIGNPTAEEILLSHSQADIFQLNGIVYSNAATLEWVQSAKLTAGELVGTIKEQYVEGIPFENEMATILPVGASIYRPVERIGPVLIVQFEDNEWRYYGLIEG